VSEVSSQLLAEASLRANIIELPSGKFLAAGQNQFRTLWTRDFCHAARGLFAIGEVEVVRDHLSRLLVSVRDDGLVPRVLDNKLVQWRVAYQTARRIFPFLPELKLVEPLRPQYTDEHGSHAVDSNLLVLLTALQLKTYPGGEAWWQTHEEKLQKVWRWYDARKRDGLIYQTAFSDWQDSVRRNGFTFLTNFFYYLAAHRLQKVGWQTGVELNVLSQRLREEFFDAESGLFLSLKGSEVISLDGNLLALEAREFLTSDEKAQLWKSLMRHPLTQLDHGLLGRCSYPDWPKRAVAWHVHLAGLKRYHGGLAWSWLMGLGLKVAHEQGDRTTVERMLHKVHTLLQRDQDVMELYDPKDLWFPWESWLLTAERPFSWGAGYLIEALQKVREKHL
jgi:hypothetical protein